VLTASNSKPIGLNVFSDVIGFHRKYKRETLENALTLFFYQNKGKMKSCA